MASSAVTIETTTAGSSTRRRRENSSRLNGRSLANNDVDLVSTGNVDYVEDRAMLQGVLGVFSVHVEPAGSASANEGQEMIAVGLHHHIDILGGARSAVVGTGDRPGNHVSDLGCVQQRRDLAEQLALALHSSTLKPQSSST